MNQKNIDQLATRLEGLGCGPMTRQRLAAFACFGPAYFDLPCVQEISGETCEFIVHCTRGDQGLYDALYYTAVLKRKPPVPAGLEGLDESFGSIDWKALIAAREGSGSFSASDAVQVADVLKQLHETDPGGLIRFRHWAGTALESMMPNINALKAQFELSQRFYLLPDQTPIRFDEACRFLQSRWMEKKVNADRKLLVKNDRSEAANAGSKGGKLLTKRTKANRKPGLFNR